MKALRGCSMRCFICTNCVGGLVLFDQIDNHDPMGFWAWICQNQPLCGKLHSAGYRASALETGETEVEDPPLKLLTAAEDSMGRRVRRAPISTSTCCARRGARNYAHR